MANNRLKNQTFICWSENPAKWYYGELVFYKSKAKAVSYTKKPLHQVEIIVRRLT